MNTSEHKKMIAHSISLMPEIILNGSNSEFLQYSLKYLVEQLNK